MRNFIFVICWAVLAPFSTFALPFQGREIAMSAANRLAVDAATKIAEKGGNVVDIAVELVLVMSVTNPQFATLGGGGFALVRMGKDVSALDFRERAPEATNPEFFMKKPTDSSINGANAIAVPGTLAGLWELHQKYGKLRWAQLFDDPYILAQKGFRVSGRLANDFKNNAGRLNLYAKQYFLKNASEAYGPGEKLVQKNYARALTEIKNSNVNAFYKGSIAKDIVNTVQKSGGVISLSDLTNYKTAWRKPITINHSGYKLYLMPPPSSGGVIVETFLKLVEAKKLQKYEEFSGTEFHLLGQIFNRVFRLRPLIGDPDHQSVNLEKLTSENNISQMAKSINEKEVTDYTSSLEFDSINQESAQTTHLSVIDKFGNAVSMTITLNGNFGSGVATEKYGIMLNNEMDDFTTNIEKPNMFGLIQGSANRIAPGKRPLSSMTPTLVEKDGKIIMAIGAPGGPRIISSVAQVLYRVLDRNSSLESAVESPRVHQQVSPNKLFLDEGRFSPEIINDLKTRKNIIERGWQGSVYAVRNVNGILEAVVDSRNEGATGGY